MLEYSPFSVALGPDFQVGTRRRRVIALAFGVDQQVEML